MNIPTSPLGAEAAANPELFKSVWRQFHNMAENAGATNITWVWCPNVKYPGSTPLKSLYPGNAYVDWTCMDGYNHGTKTPEWAPWTSFYDLFSGTYQELVSSEFEGHEKPIMIGETASTEVGGSKPEWISEALGSVLPTSFPRIEAMLWFNWNITENGTLWDWPIESSADSTAAFANAISSSFYAPGSFGSLAALTRIQPLP
jgi:beta-mannanase